MKRSVAYFRVYTKGKKLWQFNASTRLNPSRIGFLDTEKILRNILSRCPTLNIDVNEYENDYELKSDSIVSTL